MSLLLRVLNKSETFIYLLNTRSVNIDKKVDGGRKSVPMSPCEISLNLLKA